MIDNFCFLIGGDKMSLIDTLKQDLVNAMKEKNKLKLNTLRAVKGALQLEIINNKKEESDELLLDVINKQIKMRKDSIEEFKKANRQDLIDSYQEEIMVLENYMPKALSEEEVDSIIKGAIEKLGASSVKDMGSVMKEITPLVKNRCDMKEVSNKIRSILS